MLVHTTLELLEDKDDAEAKSKEEWFAYSPVCRVPVLGLPRNADR